MTNLDNFTIFATCCLLCGVFFVFWFIHGLLFKKHQVYSLAMSGFNICICIGLGAYTFRTYNDYLIGSMTSDTFLYLGAFLGQSGIYTYFNKSFKKTWWYFTAILIVHACWWLKQDSYLADLTSALYISAVIVNVAYLIYKELKLDSLKTKRFIMGPLFLSAFMLCSRALELIVAPYRYTEDLTQPNFFNSFTVIGFLVAIVCLNSTFFGVGLSSLLAVAQKLANTDALTGALNRRFFNNYFNAVASSKSAIILLDVDHFKKINDELGHDIGDDVLRDLTIVLQSVLESYSNVFEANLCRVGGEEFGIIIKNTNKSQVLELCEVIHKEIAQAHWPHALKKAPTVSIGVAHCTKSLNLSDIYKCADTALYTSKNTGRNKTTVFED